LSEHQPRFLGVVCFLPILSATEGSEFTLSPIGRWIRLPMTATLI